MRCPRARSTGAAALTVAAVLFCLSPLAWARGASAGTSWTLPKRLYPAGTRVSHMPPTNANMDQEFGQFLTASFEQQGRIDGRGRLQVGITAYPHAAGLTLEYAVSYFPSTAAMRGAARSYHILRAHRMSNGLYGGASTGGAGDASFRVLGRSDVLIDLYCWLTATHNGREARDLTTYCAKQQDSLTRKLLALIPPTASPTPSPHAGSTAAINERGGAAEGPVLPHPRIRRRSDAGRW
jgi:hypothetical protein